MKNDEFKIIIAILALVIVLGSLLAGFNLYYKIGVEKPLKEQLLMTEAVKEVVVNKDKVYKIEIQLGPVDNLQEVYRNLLKAIESKINGNDYELILADQPNLKLKELSRQLQPAIYQALADNQFLWLDERLVETSEKEKIEYRFLIDEKYIYIQLTDDDNYVYQVLTRPSNIKTS